MINQTTAYAMEIVAALIKGRIIDEKNNEDLLRKYELNSEVSGEVDELLEFFDCKVYQGTTRGIYISPLVNNKYFGYSNDELKKKLGVKNNEGLYMCYFIMATVVNMYYKDDSGVSPVMDYLSAADVVDEVSKRISALKKNLESDLISKEDLENKEGCKKLIDMWENEIPELSQAEMAQSKKKRTKGTSSKTSAVYGVLDFMKDEELVMYTENLDVYYVQERLEVMVYQVYKNSKYLEFLRDITINLDEVDK